MFVPSVAQQPVLHREQRHTRSRADTGLGIDVLDVRTDGLGRDAQFDTRLFVAPPAPDPTKDIDFAFGQTWRAHHVWQRRRVAGNREHRVDRPAGLASRVRLAGQDRSGLRHRVRGPMWTGFAERDEDISSADQRGDDSELIDAAVIAGAVRTLVMPSDIVGEVL